MLDHLSRDRPDLLEQVNAGTLKVKTAARQAGIVKTPTALDLLRRAWQKATEDERRAFLADDPMGVARLVGPLLTAEERETLQR